MKKLFLLIACTWLLTTGAQAQELVGKITDGDSAKTALFQAEVTQMQDGKVLAIIKTYFDGTFRIKVKPSQTYQIRAHYGGRTDSTVTVSVDKNGTLLSGTLFISLRKDGLRLMGYIIDRDQDIPIQDAGLILKNVMTRREDKYFTDVNGYYNLKMDFETNYSLKVDKRSPGIINKYQDTSFNISTIGFNQPLDFRFDIKLGPAVGYTAPRKDYDPRAMPSNKNLKPVVEVLGKKDSVKLREQAEAIAALDRQLKAKDSILESLNKRIETLTKNKEEAQTAHVPEAKTKKKEREDADRKADEEKQKQAALEAQRANMKKKQEEEIKQKQLQEKELQEKIAREAKAAEERKKEQELADRKRAEQEKADKAEFARLQAEKAKRDQELAEKLKNERITQEAKAKAMAEQQERARQDSILQAAADLKRIREQKENEAKAKAEQEAKQKKEKMERDLAEMKKAREASEEKMRNEKREQEIRDRQAKIDGRRAAKELAEEQKLLRKAEEIAQKNADEAKRKIEKRKQEEAEQRELEAKRAQEEQEKSKLMQQRDRVQRDEQIKVTKEPDTKPQDVNPDKTLQETIQKNTMQYWERKVREQNSANANTVNLGATSGVTKVVKAKGFAKNSQTGEPLENVSVNIRRLNSVVSQEVTTDNTGIYSFQVDSGYFYLVSYYKDKYEISKQILDLTTFQKNEYTMLIQYLKEVDDFDPNAKMPVIQFAKNTAKLPDDLWGDLQSIIKMMNEIPTLKLKLYGLGSIDEDYPMELAISRARTVANLFLEAGIKPSRIRINGIGPYRPRSGCVEGKECTQEQYKKDRVILYKVIKD